LNCTGAVVSAQQLPGLASIESVPAGVDAGRVVAAVGSGVALLFPDGRLLRTDSVDASIGDVGVDPVCGDVLVNSRFGPLVIAHDTLGVSALDVSLQLIGISAGAGGVVGILGQDLYAYTPPAHCAGKGSFSVVATSTYPVNNAALSQDGSWVATSNDRFLELLPRSDGPKGLSAQTLDWGDSGAGAIAFENGKLTAIHALGQGGAISTYAPGTLHEAGSFSLATVPDLLQWIRFASAWMVGETILAPDGAELGTHVTFWSAGAGVLTAADVPRTVTLPTAASADGIMLLGESQIGPDWGVDTLLVQVSHGQFVQQVGPRVALPGGPERIISSPDGGRLYISLPGSSSIALVE
jgi:hypothetical protein